MDLTAVVEEADGGRWGCFEAGDGSAETPYPVRGRLFSRLLERLPEALSYRSDDYVVCGLLPRDRHVPGKGGEVNRNEGTHSRLRDRLRRLQRKTKGVQQERGDAAGFHSPGLSEAGLNLIASACREYQDVCTLDISM